MGGEQGRETLDLALELGDATVRLLLALAAGLSDNALALGLCAAQAGLVRVWVAIASDFEPATRLAGARLLGIVGISRIYGRPSREQCQR